MNWKNKSKLKECGFGFLTELTRIVSFALIFVGLGGLLSGELFVPLCLFTMSWGSQFLEYKFWGKAVQLEKIRKELSK